jgi:SOS response regulatory protein OraA/RecX
MDFYTEEEIEIAKEHLAGRYNEVQLNYVLAQRGIDKYRMESLLEKISRNDPMAVAAKVLVGMMMFHFLACTVYAIVQHIRS